MVIAGNDQVNLSGEGQSKYFIIIWVAGHYAGCMERRHQYQKCPILRNQCLNGCFVTCDALREFWISEHVSKLIDQRRAAIGLDRVVVDSLVEQSTWRTVP